MPCLEIKRFKPYTNFFVSNGNTENTVTLIFYASIIMCVSYRAWKCKYLGSAILFTTFNWVNKTTHCSFLLIYSNHKNEIKIAFKHVYMVYLYKLNRCNSILLWSMGTFCRIVLSIDIMWRVGFITSVDMK